jgi:hypothetical protein
MKLPHEVSWGSALLVTLGRGESRPWRIVFAIATVLGLAANFIVLLGCMTPSTQSIYLFRVNSQDLINATASLTNVSVDALEGAWLPTHWYFGLSGTCAVWDDDSIACKRAFPPSLSVESMLNLAISSSPNPPSTKDDLKNTETNDKDEEDSDNGDLPQPWRRALKDLSPLLSAPSPSPSTYLKITSALSILSTLGAITLLTLTILSLTPVWDGHPPRWLLYGPAFLDASLVAAAGVLIIQALRGSGPRVLLEMADLADKGGVRGYVGPGAFVLFAGALVKLISVPIFLVLVFFPVLLVVFIIAFSIGKRIERKREEQFEEIVDQYPGYPASKTYV